jgi:ribose/xylose/arabinose/galactoside ABC-type transport system permease subunit
MSPLTVFLAKLLGLYCIVAAVAMMTRKESAIATIEQLTRNPPLLLLVEVVGLAGGLSMIIGHNIWSGGALPIVITLIGWLMAIRGAVLLALSHDATIKLFEALRYRERFYWYMGGTLVLGLYLTFAGFRA